mmetsp:Transcript_24945/g.94325  ORF Transcript_24945/g.94325 Transcript_24945/m.94325 type:complete len:281 (-) Transcript_24945:2146-2988(-)
MVGRMRMVICPTWVYVDPASSWERWPRSMCDSVSTSVLPPEPMIDMVMPSRSQRSSIAKSLPERRRRRFCMSSRMSRRVRTARSRSRPGGGSGSAQPAVSASSNGSVMTLTSAPASRVMPAPAASRGPRSKAASSKAPARRSPSLLLGSAAAWGAALVGTVPPGLASPSTPAAPGPIWPLAPMRDARRARPAADTRSWDVLVRVSEWPGWWRLAAEWAAADDFERFSNTPPSLWCLPCWCARTRRCSPSSSQGWPTRPNSKSSMAESRRTRYCVVVVSSW